MSNSKVDRINKIEGIWFDEPGNVVDGTNERTPRAR